jgi:hypothetical protein
MGQFNEISRELGHTFAELERARGKSRRSWLRRAHLLLLLADEMMVFSGSAEEDAAGGLPLNEPAVNGRRQSPNGMATADDGDDQVQVKDVVIGDRLKSQMFLHFFAETGVHSTKRGSCQGLQTVLVLRSSSGPGKNPGFAGKSQTPPAES